MIPFLDSVTIRHLKDEFPIYYALDTDIDPSYDICKF